MSDLMLYGVLRMPYEMAMASELSRRQFYSRVQEAADRLEKAERATQPASAPAEADEIAVMRVELDMYRTIYGTEIPASWMAAVGAPQGQAEPVTGGDLLGLLQKYITHVYESEGVDHITAPWNEKPDTFTSIEWKLLTKIANGKFAAPTQPTQPTQAEQEDM